MAIEQKTTSISNEKWNRLEVEWNTYHPHIRRMPDDTFQQVEEHKVTLVLPATKFLSSEGRRTRLVDLSPQTALNLLAWLEQEKPLLQALASHDHDED